jgi:hypothetical protein
VQVPAEEIERLLNEPCTIGDVRLGLRDYFKRIATRRSPEADVYLIVVESAAGGEQRAIFTKC